MQKNRDTGNYSKREIKIIQCVPVFLSAVLFYLSFPNRVFTFGFWPCIWVFALPLLAALQEEPLKNRLALGLFWGLCANGLMAQGLIRISPAGFFAFVLGLSLQAVIFAGLCRPASSLWAGVCLLPCLWCLSEFLRNYLLGGFSFYISHALAFCPPLLKLYGHLGCLGMSFIIFLVNALLYAGVKAKGLAEKKISALCFIAAVLVFLSVVAAGMMRSAPAGPAARHLSISVIQANISPREKADPGLFDKNAALHLTLTEQSFEKGHPDLVIWPETAFPDDLLQNDQWRTLITAQALHMNTDLLLGIAPILEGKEYNSALMISNLGQIVGLYHKQALVPFAETVPLAPWGINWGRGYRFSPGKKPGIFLLSRTPVLFGVVICSESAHPDMVRRMRRMGIKFLVEISNDGWFTDKASSMLHAQAAILRAVENGIWVIREANTGFSFAVDPEGVVHTDGNLKLGREGFGIFDIMVQ